jgi:hypothetical protein
MHVSDWSHLCSLSFDTSPFAKQTKNLFYFLSGKKNSKGIVIEIEVVTVDAASQKCSAEQNIRKLRWERDDEDDTTKEAESRNTLRKTRQGQLMMIKSQETTSSSVEQTQKDHWKGKEDQRKGE